MTVIGINWLENFLGDPGDQLRSLVRRLHPDIRVVSGTPETGRLFGSIRSVPAVLIFDSRGREVFRLGGDQGRGSNRHVHVHHIKEAISRDQLEKAVKGIR